MFSNLKGGPLVAIVAVVLSIIGAATALVWNGNLTGSDWLVIITPILAGVTGVAAAHVTGNAVAAATSTPVAGMLPLPAQPGAPATGPLPTNNISPAAQPAMPTGG